MSTLPRRALAAAPLTCLLPSLLLLVGCDVRPAHIELSPTPLTLKVDDELDLNVQVLDDNRKPIKRVTPKLSIEGEPVVKVEPTTLSLVGMRPGLASLVVQAGDLKQVFPVRVLAAEVEREADNDEEIDDVFDLAPEPAPPSAEEATEPDYDEVPAAEEPAAADDDDGAGIADGTE